MAQKAPRRGNGFDQICPADAPGNLVTRIQSRPTSTANSKKSTLSSEFVFVNEQGVSEKSKSLIMLELDSLIWIQKGKYNGFIYKGKHHWNDTMCSSPVFLSYVFAWNICRYYLAISSFVTYCLPSLLFKSMLLILKWQMLFFVHTVLWTVITWQVTPV